MPSSNQWSVRDSKARASKYCFTMGQGLSRKTARTIQNTAHHRDFAIARQATFQVYGRHATANGCMPVRNFGNFDRLGHFPHHTKPSLSFPNIQTQNDQFQMFNPDKHKENIQVSCKLMNVTLTTISPTMQDDLKTRKSSS